MLSKRPKREIAEQIRCGSADALVGQCIDVNVNLQSLICIYIQDFFFKIMSEDLSHQHEFLEVSSQLSSLNLGGDAEKGQDLLQRCRVLLDELEQLQRYLVEEKKEDVELRHFKNTVKAESKLLEKVPICS